MLEMIITYTQQILFFIWITTLIITIIYNLKKQSLPEHKYFTIFIVILIFFTLPINILNYYVNEKPQLDIETKIQENQKSWCASEWCGNPENAEIIEHNKTRYCVCIFNGHLFKSTNLGNNEDWLKYNITNEVD